MKRTILRYGAIGSLILIVINVVLFLALGVPGPEDFALGEVLGYATIIVALLPIFFAIRYYRDEHASGRLSFWKGLGIGSGVSLLPSAAFAAYNWIYVTWLDPDFNEKYYSYAIEKARLEMSPAEFEVYSAQMQSQAALFAEPWFMAFVMFATVFLIGVVITIISALVLQKKQAVVPVQ